MQETRYVVIPDPCSVTVDVVDAEGNPKKRLFVMNEEAFVRERTADPLFGGKLDDVLSAMAIRQAFTGCATGQVVGLGLAEWELLCKSVREPTGGYNPAVMIQCVPLARAILDATSTDPRPKEG